MSVFVSMSSWRWLFANLQSWSRRALQIALFSIALNQPANADIRPDAPWHAASYAYLNTLFLLNLDPVDWGLIEEVLTTDHDGRIIGRPASERLIALDEAAGTSHWDAIETALAAQKAVSLHAAMTRALSAGIRQHLAQASAALDQPGLASAEMDQAQALFGAFAVGIEQTDPQAFRQLGLAWLELTSSVRQTDVIAEGALPANRAAFTSARALLAGYLTQNFEPEMFADREAYAPIPETRVLADPNAALAPWLPPGSQLADQNPPPRLALNYEKWGGDALNLFLVSYGDMLFDSPEIFGSPARDLGITCSTCHNQGDINQRFFIPGISPHPGAADIDGSLFNARFNDHRTDPLDIPSLRGLRFTAPYGRDGRFASLRDITRTIIVNMFKGDEPSPLVLDALVAYMQELDFLAAPNLERDGRLKATSSEAAKRGEVLFNQTYPSMNGRACASCHLPSSHFTDNQVHDLGSAGDGASGGFSGAFDTPTLLGILHTAPYLHDGRFETLEGVVAWKSEIFGLDLDAAAREDLTAYLEAVGEGEDAYKSPDAETTAFQSMVEELTVFLCGLDTLIPDRDRDHADLLLRTVAGRMEREAALMTVRVDRGRTKDLAASLWRLRDLILQEAWDDAAGAWQDYKNSANSHEQALR